MNKFCVVLLISLLLALSSGTAFAQVSTSIGNGKNFYCYQTDDVRQIIRISDNSSRRRWQAIRECNRGITRYRRLARRARRDGNLQLAQEYRDARAAWRVTKADVISCWKERGKFAYTPGDDDDGGGGGGSSNACNIISDPSSFSSSSTAAVSIEDEVTARIIDGTACTVGNTPVAKILKNGQFLCSGTLVAANYVISAAHCFEGGTSGTSVTVGGSTISASAVYVHSSWDSNSSTPHINDVAVIKLSSNSSANVALVNGSNNYQAGEVAVIAGYGLDENNGSGTLKAATALVGSQTNSQGIHIRYTGDDGHGDTCSGDSGGPIFVSRGGGEYYLAGTTSWGNPNCTPVDDAWFSNINDPSNVSFISTYISGLF